MSVRVTKEVEFIQDVDIEVDLEDFDDDDLIQELLDRGCDIEIMEKLDEQANSWEFTRKARDYFVSQMAKVETVYEVTK